MKGVSLLPPKDSLPEKTIHIEFTDNKLLPLLFGDKDRFLNKIEDFLGLSILAKGNRILITGPEDQAQLGKTILSRLYDRLARGLVVTLGDVEGLLRHMAGDTADIKEPSEVVQHPRTRKSQNKKAQKGNQHQQGTDQGSIPTNRMRVTARSENQSRYIEALRTHDLVFALGPAGTGKTYLAVAMGVQKLLSGEIDRIILSRPAVEAGEQLGFLPGDLREKVDPYLRPLYDALYDMMPSDQVEKRLHSGEIEIAPLAYMRGRTLSHAYVILDEAQNTTKTQMKMFLTRMGEGSCMVVTGDLSQVDLPKGVSSGLRESVSILEKTKGVGIHHFTPQDVVRHPLVARIVEAYENLKKPNPYEDGDEESDA